MRNSKRTTTTQRSKLFRACSVLSQVARLSAQEVSLAATVHQGSRPTCRRITRLDQLLSDTHYDLKLPQEEKDMLWAGMEWGFEKAYRLHVDMWRNRKNIRSRYSEFPDTITAHICPLDDHNFALDHFLTDNFIHDDWYDVVEHYYVLQQAAYISSIYISCTLSSRSPHSRFYL